jgi:ubiquinone/menaquinone biosynthesis C-methylase UbiE
MGERGPTGIFDERAGEYDAWYEAPSGRATFEAELDAVRPLLAVLPRPWLEVGVGTGRFGGSLGVEVGIDPSLRSLVLARQRLHVIGAIGEALPFGAQSFGGVLCVLTLCFVRDPRQALIEMRRVLRPGGGLVLATVPADSPLGERYRALGKQGHPFYREARFFTRKELDTIVTAAGFRIVRRRSALIGFTSGEPTAVSAIDGDDSSAGFRVVLARVDAR